MKQKLCYVIPEYDPKSHTHFSYLAGFVRELTKMFDIFLIIERGEVPRGPLGCVRVACAGRGGFTRLIRVKLYLLRARLWGARRFYVHYSFFSACVAACITRMLGGKTFYWNCGEPWKYKRSLLREAFERFVYRIVHVVVTGTDGLAAHYAKQYAIPREKVVVMPNWITLETRGWRLDTGRRELLRKGLRIPELYKIVLFVHRLSRRKGAHYLPDIVEKLNDERAVFLIAGDGPERKRIEAEVVERGFRSRVRFLGWVPQDKVMDLMRMADAFLMPSDEEGFPHVFLEAMAVGLPFVGTLVGGVAEMTPPEVRSYLVAPGDVSGMSERLREILALEPREREALAARFAEWVAQYDSARVAERFREIVR